MKSKRVIINAAITLPFHVLMLLFFAPVDNSLALDGNQIKITILYDNYVFSEGAKSG